MKNTVVIVLAMKPIICKGMTSNKFYPLNQKQCYLVQVEFEII